MSGKDTITIPFESKLPVPTLREVDAYLVREGWVKKGDTHHDVQRWIHASYEGRTLQCPADESAIFWKNGVSYVIKQIIEVTGVEPFDVITEMLFSERDNHLYEIFDEFKDEIDSLSRIRAQRMEGCRQEESGE